MYLCCVLWELLAHCQQILVISPQKNQKVGFGNNVKIQMFKCQQLNKMFLNQEPVQPLLWACQLMTLDLEESKERNSVTKSWETPALERG